MMSLVNCLEFQKIAAKDCGCSQLQHGSTASKAMEKDEQDTVDGESLRGIKQTWANMDKHGQTDTNIPVISSHFRTKESVPMCPTSHASPDSSRVCSLRSPEKKKGSHKSTWTTKHHQTKYKLISSSIHQTSSNIMKILEHLWKTHCSLMFNVFLTLYPLPVLANSQVRQPRGLGASMPSSGPICWPKLFSSHFLDQQLGPPERHSNCR